MTKFKNRGVYFDKCISYATMVLTLITVTLYTSCWTFTSDEKKNPQQPYVISHHSLNHQLY